MKKFCTIMFSLLVAASLTVGAILSDTDNAHQNATICDLDYEYVSICDLDYEYVSI